MTDESQPEQEAKTVAVHVAEYAKAPADDYVPIEHLIPYARNARTHSPAQIKQIAALMIEFGVTNSALYDPNSIVAGHGRILAAELIYSQGKTLFHAPGEKKGGAPIPQGTYPAKNCDGWTAAQKQAYILADNQSALNAGWDLDLLKLEMADLDGDGFDMDLIGFDADTLDELLDRDDGSKSKRKKENEDIGGDRFLVMIECPDEASQAELFAEFQERGLTCKIS